MGSSLHVSGNVSTLLPESGNEAASRLRALLRGRKPYPWGESVRLSRGAVGRLLKGKFPDPGALVPMLRIERASLSWLLTGAGAPYLVLAPAHDGEAAQQLAAHLDDEPSWAILLVHCDEGFSVVLHQPAVSVDADGREYGYTACEIVGGAACGPEVLRVVLGRQEPRRLQQLELRPSDWRRLAAGGIGNAEMFGWERDPAALLDDARPLAMPPSGEGLLRFAMVADGPRPDYRSDEEQELLRIVRGCKPCERETILRMVRAMA